MKIYLNEITGIADAITGMYMSKSWNREKEMEIRNICDEVVDRHGVYHSEPFGFYNEDTFFKSLEKYNDLMDKVLKYGQKHITMLKFIDMSFTVEGLHRGGQDDWDAHAERFSNRILRHSTRLAAESRSAGVSEWYEGKILPTDTALVALGIEIPDTITVEGIKYIRSTNGYIIKGMENDKDVKRGLYMLSLPSNFIFKVNLTQWSHVYKERNEDGTAHPEVKICCETIADLIEEAQPKFNRELFRAIKN